MKQKEIDVLWFEKVSKSCHTTKHVRALMELYKNLVNKHKLQSGDPTAEDAWRIVKRTSDKVYQNI